MKFVSLLFLSVIFIAANINAQIPNAGFENWTSGLPDSWIATNIPGYETITQTSFCHSGSSALSGKVVSLFGASLYPPFIYSYNTTGSGFSISQKYNSLKGYYAFKPNGGDVLYVTVLMSNSGGTAIGGGSLEISASSDNYVLLEVPINYYAEEIPASCYITVGIAGPPNGEDYHEGSQMFVDDLELSMDLASGVKDEESLNSFRLSQNYPNPFNPATVINYQLPKASNVTLKIYDALGKEVETLVNGFNSAGNHEINFNGSKLSSGMYFYELRAGDFVSTKKMMLTK